VVLEIGGVNCHDVGPQGSVTGISKFLIPVVIATGEYIDK
jgi:hypothetical protein